MEQVQHLPQVQHIPPKKPQRRRGRRGRKNLVKHCIVLLIIQNSNLFAIILDPIRKLVRRSCGDRITYSFSHNFILIPPYDLKFKKTKNKKTVLFSFRLRICLLLQNSNIPCRSGDISF
jgi:hypothetical protein